MTTRMIAIGRLLGTILAACAVITPAIAAAQAKAGYGIGASALIPGRDYVIGQVIVGLHWWGRKGETPTAALPHGARVLRVIHGTALLLEFPSEQAALEAIHTLVADPNVSLVERNGFLNIPPRVSPGTNAGASK
jgi:hypothetical protein